MKYSITIVESVAYKATIEASNKEDAQLKALDAFNEGYLRCEPQEGERVDIDAKATQEHDPRTCENSVPCFDCESHS